MSTLTITSTTVGARLVGARLLAGLDQADMAAALRVSRTTVSNWERGKYEPNVSQFIAWAEITKQPADQLIDGLSSCTPWDSNPEPTD